MRPRLSCHSRSSQGSALGQIWHTICTLVGRNLIRLWLSDSRGLSSNPVSSEFHRKGGVVIRAYVIRNPHLSDHFGSVTAMPTVTANRKTEGFICPLCDTAIPGDATAVRSRICRTTQYTPRVMTDPWEPICRPCAQSGSFVLGAIPEGAKSWRRAIGKDHDPDGELCVCVTCRRSVILRRDGRRVAPTCSTVCRAKHYNENRSRGPRMSACTMCGKEFNGKRGAKTCSSACRQRAYRARTADSPTR